MNTVFGSICSGVITEPLGRKNAMLLVNIPHLIGWFLLHYSTTIVHVFVGVALLGLGVGLMEAPIITYVGEIWLVLFNWFPFDRTVLISPLDILLNSEASIRDVMISSSGLSAAIGFLFVFFLGSWLPWRIVALVCSIIPIAALFSLLSVCCL